MASPLEPRVTLIDHSTGRITELEGRPIEELASTLVSQARVVRTAAVGTPPDDDAPE
jgi:hypothetical protein